MILMPQSLMSGSFAETETAFELLQIMGCVQSQRASTQFGTLQRGQIFSSFIANYVTLTNMPDAPRASALKTSVPRRTPPSRKTGTLP